MIEQENILLGLALVVWTLVAASMLGSELSIMTI